jgi:AbrB family looped-hinge helix DNA binding protein
MKDVVEAKVDGVTIGMVRTINKSGRLYFPQELRDYYNISPGDSVLMTTTHDGGILIRPVKPHCVFCSNKATQFFRNAPVCDTCIKELKQGNNLKNQKEVWVE